jgi:hypothetical protein
LLMRTRSAVDLVSAVTEGTVSLAEALVSIQSMVGKFEGQGLRR